MNPKDLINWGQLSRLLSGSRQTVRKNSIPKIHEPFINSLLKAINNELSKLPYTAKAGGQKENKTCTDDNLKNEQPLNLQNVMQRSELLIALQNIEKCCDNENPTHQEIWRIAYSAINSA